MRARDPVFLFLDHRGGACLTVEVPLWVPAHVALQTQQLLIFFDGRRVLLERQMQRGGEDEIAGRFKAEELGE